MDGPPGAAFPSVLEGFFGRPPQASRWNHVLAPFRRMTASGVAISNQYYLPLVEEKRQGGASWCLGCHRHMSTLALRCALPRVPRYVPLQDEGFKVISALDPVWGMTRAKHDWGTARFEGIRRAAP